MMTVVICCCTYVMVTAVPATDVYSVTGIVMVGGLLIARTLMERLALSE